MKTSNGTITAVTVVVFITLFFACSEYFSFSAKTAYIDDIDNSGLDTEEEEYGFDRLEEEEELYWTPDEAHEQPSQHKIDLLDTLSLSRWQKHIDAIHLVQNPGGLWPLSFQQDIRLLRPANLELSTFLTTFSKETPFREQLYVETDFNQYRNCNAEKESIFICLMDDYTFEAMSFSGDMLKNLYDLSAQQPVIMLYYGNEHVSFFKDWPITLLQSRVNNAIVQTLSAQALVGAVDLYNAQGVLLEAQRLGKVPSNYGEFSYQKLHEIDRWVEKAIRRKVIPGCQVLVAQAGKIIYEKAFGYHTYDKKRAVSTEDVYDIASITKAAATTLAVMKQEENGQLELAGRIRDYVPEFRRTSFSYLRIRHLLAHHTGLQGNLPIATFLNRKDVFQKYPSKEYSWPLSKDLFIKNGVKEDLLTALKKVKAPRRHFFRYSDVNFIILQQLLEHQTGQPLDQYLTESFYQPLGLQYLQYRPGLTMDEKHIVPTELDNRWRKQLVHGEVHDESALLLGGVAGSAGLFSNARDLAVIFQMLLNDGSYGGDQFFEPTTIERFTSKNNYNYRAYGFDRLAGHSKNLKHYGASLKTFGHTGFTGTCVWADPDNDLVFIFLSNRIHPSKRNNKLQKMGLRERLHKIVYQSLREGRKLAMQG